LNGSLRRSLGALGVAGFLVGCGPSDQGADAKGTVTGPNRKLLNSKKFDSEEYKKMLGKDGKPAWRPGEMPKS
jgi:hypothetical protein